MAIACLLLAGASAVAAPAYADDEFTLGEPVTLSGTDPIPVDITLGPDGNAWFTNLKDPSNYGLGRVTPDGQLTYFPQAFPAGFHPGDGLDGVTAGPDGNLWYVLKGTLDAPKMAIGRITPSGDVTMFTAGLTRVPAGITRGPDGNLWFTELHGVGRITTAGQITEFNSPTDFPGASSPQAIAAGPDGNVWFVDNDGVDAEFGGGSNGSIGRVTPAGVVTRFTVGLGPQPGPKGIIAGPDGAMWFTEAHDKKLGRITTDGVITLFDLPADQNYPPQGMTKGLRANELYVGTTNGVVRVRFPSSSLPLGAMPSAHAAQQEGGGFQIIIGSLTLNVRAGDLVGLAIGAGLRLIAAYRKAGVLYTGDVKPGSSGTTPTGSGRGHPLSPEEKAEEREQARRQYDKDLMNCEPGGLIGGWNYTVTDDNPGGGGPDPIHRLRPDEVPLCKEDITEAYQQALKNAEADPPDVRFFNVALPRSRSAGRRPDVCGAKRAKSKPSACRALSKETQSYQGKQASAVAVGAAQLITANRFLAANAAGNATGIGLQTAVMKVLFGELLAAQDQKYRRGLRWAKAIERAGVRVTISAEQAAVEKRELLELSGPFAGASRSVQALGFSATQIKDAVVATFGDIEPRAAVLVTELRRKPSPMPATKADYRSMTLTEVSAIVAALKKQKAISSSLAKKLNKDLKAAGKGKTARKKNMRKFRDHAKKAKATPEKFLRTAAQPLAG
jgi:streptogramin lyase